MNSSYTKILALIVKSKIASLIIIGVFLALWEMLSVIGFINPYLWEVFVPPSKIVSYAEIAIVNPPNESAELLRHIIATTERTTVAFATGSVTGILVGLVLGWWRKLDSTFTPIIEFLRPVPMLTLYPIFLLLLGVGTESKIATAAISVFFVVAINSLYGARSVDRLLVYSLRTMGASGFQIFRKAVLFSALPYIGAAMRLSIITALLVTVATEMIQSYDGLGYMIEISSETLNYGFYWVGIVSSILLGLLMVYVWLQFEERFLRWHRERTARGA